MTGKPLLLMRRRRWPWVVAAGVAVLVAAGIAAALVLPGVLRYSPNGIPRAQGSDAIEGLTSAQERFLADHGRYASSIDELAADADARFRGHLDVNESTTSNEDGDAYLGWAVGVTGGYTAVISTGGEDSHGHGDSIQSALADAGWSSTWAREHGFRSLPDTDRAYGAVDVSDTGIVVVRLDEDTLMYTATLTPVPVTATADTWQDAVDAAGVDPATFDWEGKPGKTPATVSSTDGHTRMMVVGVDGQVTVRIERDGRTGEPSRDARVAADEVVDADKLGDLSTLFRCATSQSVDGLYTATVCADTAGRVVAYASNGKAAQARSVPAALDQIAVTGGWASRHGVDLPEAGDLQ